MLGVEAWKSSAICWLKEYVALSNYYKSMCKKTNKQKTNQ